ncbi:hypothetical protein ADILRU_2546 [Leifsonia rubra CMS 76R]|nr:hypothetical protein ADILRU_2546 [Leifsonia rubra CMS 76R]
MKRSRRPAAIVAAAVLLSLTLGGCSFVGDAGQVFGILAADAEKQRKLADVVSELERIDGVESASSTFAADGPSGDEAQLQVTVSAAATKEQAREIATVTDDAFFSSVELAETVPLLTIRIAGNKNSVLTRSFFNHSDEEFANDFEYWRTIQEVIGTELSMSLTPGFVTSTYERTFSAPEGVDAVRTAVKVIDNIEKLEAVDDETNNSTIWAFAGMRSYPHLPSADVVGLLDDIRGTFPLLDHSGIPENPGPEFEYPEGVVLMWNKPSHEQSAMAELLITQREYRDDDWRDVIEAGVRSAQVPGLNFRYASGEQQFQLHTSTCDGTIYESSDDQKLFESVLASGTEFLDGAGPGACIPER